MQRNSLYTRACIKRQRLHAEVSEVNDNQPLVIRVHTSVYWSSTLANHSERAHNVSTELQHNGLSYAAFVDISTDNSSCLRNGRTKCAHVASLHPTRNSKTIDAQQTRPYIDSHSDRRPRCAFLETITTSCSGSSRPCTKQCVQQSCPYTDNRKRLRESRFW